MKIRLAPRSATRLRPLVALTLIAVAANLMMPVGGSGKLAAEAATLPSWGVYTGPGPAGAAGAKAYAASTGIKITHVLDFLPDDSWDQLSKPDWLINAYKGTPYQLELAVPMLPRQGSPTLRLCSNGAYNGYWKTLAKRLRAAQLSDTIIRPGWEANGGWYAWSAIGRPGEYIGCYRQLVSSMRSIAPQLRFSWTVNNGYNPIRGEIAYPGDLFVDIVGVDAYDFNWTWYPAPAGMTVDEARLRAVRSAVEGERGLNYWSAFAAKHRKPLAVPEWGLAWRADGHAGADNILWVDTVIAFVKDPRNNVAYATYFNAPDAVDIRHNVSSRTTMFPAAGRQLTRLSRT